MTEDRWDPQMRAWQRGYEAAAAKHPPIRLEMPLQPHREVNDILNLRYAAGGPAMAASHDRWIGVRGRRVQVRLHLPSAPPADGLPALVYFHGGGWVWSSIDTHDRLARELAAGGGVAVVAVDYALSPEAKFPQALEECAGVVAWLARHGAGWGIDPHRLLVGGDSAGGNLCLATALMLRDSDPATFASLAGILAFYPVCDAACASDTHREFATGHWLTAEKMRFYWDAYLPHHADRAHPWASPLHARLEGLPPTLVALAELDVLRGEGEALAGRLREAGCEVELAIYPGTIHGFVRATETVARAAEAVAAAGDWLRRHGRT